MYTAVSVEAAAGRDHRAQIWWARAVSLQCVDELGSMLLRMPGAGFPEKPRPVF